MKTLICFFFGHEWEQISCKGTPLSNHGWLGWLADCNFNWTCKRCGKTK